MNKTSIIFDGSGQDAIYMCKLLLKKNYKIIYITEKLKQNLNHRNIKVKKKIDIFNKIQIQKLIITSKCDEIYFFAEKLSLLKFHNNSFETITSNIIPVYYILEILKGSKKKIKFYDTSSCEIFQSLKKKKIKMRPYNSYRLSKLINFYFTKFYRERYDLKCFSTIFSHHESNLRKKNFLIPKI